MCRVAITILLVNWQLFLVSNRFNSVAEPELVLPTLVGKFFSTNEGVQMSASHAVTVLLINHKHKPEVLCMFLDSIRYITRFLYGF